MLSGLVEVVMTAPGASRIALIAMCRPLPDPGGPTTRMLRSHDAHTVLAAGGAQEVADVGGCGPVEARVAGSAAWAMSVCGGGGAADGLGGGPPGPGVERRGAALRGGGAVAAPPQDPRAPRSATSAATTSEQRAPCSDRWDAGDVRRAGRAAPTARAGVNAGGGWPVTRARSQPVRVDGGEQQRPPVAGD